MKTFTIRTRTFHFPLKNAYTCVAFPPSHACFSCAKGLRHHTAIDRMMGADDHLPGLLALNRRTGSGEFTHNKVRKLNGEFALNRVNLTQIIIKVRKLNLDCPFSILSMSLRSKNPNMDSE
jgi:hypothetical protein